MLIAIRDEATLVCSGGAGRFGTVTSGHVISGLHKCTISSYYVQAVRTKSRYKRQFGSNSLLFTQFKTVLLDSQPRVNESASVTTIECCLEFRTMLFCNLYMADMPFCDPHVFRFRAFFLALFRHLVFVGERGCYRTSLEFCKLILRYCTVYV